MSWFPVRYSLLIVGINYGLNKALSASSNLGVFVAKTPFM